MQSLCSFASWSVLQVEAWALLLSAKGLPIDHSGSYIVLWKKKTKYKPNKYTCKPHTFTTQHSLDHTQLT